MSGVIRGGWGWNKTDAITGSTRVWKHTKTGEIAGPVIGDKARPNPPDNLVTGLLLGLFVLLGAGLLLRAGSFSPDVAKRLFDYVVFGVPILFGLRSVALPMRIITGVLGTVISYVLGSWATLPLIALTVMAVRAHGSMQSTINDKMRQKGFEPALPGRPNDYTGTWDNRNGERLTEWKSGRLVGVYHEHDVPTVGKGTYLKPEKSAQYPFGWMFDASLPGYVPRQNDPFESPAPTTWETPVKTDAYGDNEPLNDKQLEDFGASHPMPGPRHSSSLSSQAKPGAPNPHGESKPLTDDELSGMGASHPLPRQP